MGEGYTPPAGAGGGGAVSSVAGRTGDVVLAVADVSGAAPTASPSFSGTVTLPSGIVIPSGADISGVLGTTGSKAAAGNDARLSDARTPTAHKTSHATGGSDAIAVSDIGAAPTASPTFTGTVTLPSGNAPWGIAQAGLLARLNQRSKSPAAHGMSFWTALPEACNSSPFAYTVSTLYLVRLYDVPPQTITNLLTAIGSNGTSLTLAQLAAFTVSGTTATRVAITADQHVDWNTNGQATKVLPVNSGTPYSFPGGDVILAVLQVGTTSAQLFAQNTGSSNAVIMNVNQSAASGNLYASQKGSQATMPTSIDLTTCTALGVVMFVGGN